MKMTVFWAAAPCSLVEVYVSEVLTAPIIRVMSDHLGTLMMEAARTSETSVNFCQTTLRNIPEVSRLDTRRRENLKSHQYQNRL
jgi:hypothetical protein